MVAKTIAGEIDKPLITIKEETELANLWLICAKSPCPSLVYIPAYMFDKFSKAKAPNISDVTSEIIII